MNATRFDRLVRAYSIAKTPRRQTLLALALGTVGLPTLGGETTAGPGCKNFGKKCKKNKGCCSGICKGKKGKKRCKAHDTGGCQAGQTFPACGGALVQCTTSTAAAGACITTSGNAGYCSATTNCFSCQRDADCVPNCGPQAACVTCAMGCASTDGTACAGPSPTSCNFPP